MSDQNVNDEFFIEKKNEENSNVEGKENDENGESSTQTDQDGKSGGNSIPYERFKEVNSNFKQSQTKISELEAQLEEMRTSKEPEKEVDYDSLSQKELLDLATKNAVNQIKNESSEKVLAKEKHQKYISEKLQDFTDEGIKFDEEKLFKIAMQTGGNLDSAMELYKEFNPVSNNLDEEKSKARLKASESVRGNQRNTGGQQKPNLRNMSFHQLAQNFNSGKK